VRTLPFSVSPAADAVVQDPDESPGSVMLRWHPGKGRSAIPKSIKSHRIAQKFDVFLGHRGVVDFLHATSGRDADLAGPPIQSGEIPDRRGDCGDRSMDPWLASHFHSHAPHDRRV
jgi:hypothetical protein